MRAVKSFFTIHEVVVLTGFSKHMLDYLAREEIFAPRDRAGTGRGFSRKYLYEDVVWLRALNTICAGKGKIRHLKAALLRFRDEFGPLQPGQRVEKCLFVQGDELYVRTSSEGGRQLRSGQMTLGFFVDLAAVSQEIADCVLPIPASRDFSLIDEVIVAAEAEKQKTWARIKGARLRASG